jgi:cell fate (sporulation/competence/biofilm development) regulator YmcA (YheA/YmcA/DUF963 family)
MNEMQYKDIFKDPETIKNLKAKSVTSRERMLGNDKLMKIVQRSAVLIDQLSKDEAPYRSSLEKLAVDMVKKMYPVIDEFGIWEGHLTPTQVAQYKRLTTTYPFE